MGKQYLIADDGVRIPVHVEGSGPPLVALPGWTGSWQDWGPAAEGLRERFTCYAWHARPYHADNGDIGRMAMDLHNLLAQFELEKPVLLGHSMGAVNAWEYIRRYGDGAFSKLALIDMSPKLLVGDDWSMGLWGRFTAEENARFIQACREDFAEAVIDLIAHSRVALQGSGPGIPKDILLARRRRLEKLAGERWITAWQSFVGEDYRPVLPRITIPTFCAFGAKSAYYGPAVAEYVAGQIPHSHLVIYPEAGHGPHVEAAEQFLADLDAFLATTGSAA
ncbi:alpha/beta fold hydrolase [Alkalilimnicola sp. S0819]|uniref:alpha/beta fold hydrolase n=1 Tax=Alkalilimnicola sp. S0819 TaxID=2613922 RepID=UPI0012614F7D|nr:alpha/beta hydrolase [Alkalilimnicola sp. S0819]KAB7622974.1 alpha/beta hydrolase [Alkalilimnicola sp. S0819]MPQ17083.1 alpha/beta fold hydrolase [Alkalilimnicola sp. S0819]